MVRLLLITTFVLGLLCYAEVEQTNASPLETQSNELIEMPSLMDFGMGDSISLRPEETPEELIESLRLVRAGNYSEAVTRIKSYIETHPQSAPAHEVLGIAYAKQGEFEDVLKLVPSDRIAHQRLGALAQKQIRFATTSKVSWVRRPPMSGSKSIWRVCTTQHIFTRRPSAFCRRSPSAT